MTGNLNITISQNNTLNNDIKAVCKDITEHYKILIPDGPPLGNNPLNVIYNSSSPITIVNGLPNNYIIGLNVDDRYYSQIVFQFAHELTHIYCDPRITNWFIESLCEMASLYFLEFMTDKWATDPPFPQWKEYAPNFLDYKNNYIIEVKRNLEITENTNLDEMLEDKLSILTGPTNRDVNTLIALYLLRIFKNNKNAWKLLPHIGQMTDKELVDNTFYSNSIPDFDKLLSLASREEKLIVEEIRKTLFK